MSTHPTIRIETLLEHEPFVRSVLRNLVQDENQVQDLVQETWVRAMRRPPQESKAIKGWLARVAKNLVRDSHRRNSTRTQRENAVSRPEADTAGASSEERLRLHQQIVDAVMALQEPYRGVMILTYYEELSASAIAAKLDRKPSTVRSQIHRAHELLRSKLDTDYGTRSSWMLVAAPMLKWDKPAAAKAAGFGIAQLAGYTALAASLVGMGIWVESMVSNSNSNGGVPASDGSTAELVASASGSTDPVDSGLDTGTSQGSPSGSSEDATGTSHNANSGLASTSMDTSRTHPLMDWSVRVTDGGKPVEGAEVVIRMEEGEQTVPDYGVDGTWGGFYSWSDPGLLKVVSGEDGRAVYTLPKMPIQIWAFSVGAAGTMVVDQVMGSEVHLELSPAFAAHIQVVNEAGEPVEGVPIVVTKYLNPKGSPFSTDGDNLHYDVGWTSSEGSEGRAVFYGEGESGGLAIGDEKQRHQNFAVHLGIPGLVNKIHRLDGAKGRSIDNPMRVVVPATGSLDVRVVEANGELSIRPGRVTLRSDPKYTRTGEVRTYATVTEGVAHFPLVPANQEFVVVFQSQQTGVEWSETVQGPSESGAKGTCTIRGVSTPVIRGRLTGDPGPFGNGAYWGLYLFLLGPERKVLQRTGFIAKPDGIFEVSLKTDVALNDVSSMQILGLYWTNEGLRPRWDLEGTLTPGNDGHDLGTIELQWVSDRIWGQVVDSEGQPVVGAYLSVETGHARNSTSSESNANGEFKMEAVFARTATLTVSEYLGGPEQTVEVQVADNKPLLIELQSFASLQGNLIMPIAGGRSQYTVWVVSMDPKGAATRNRVGYVDFDSGFFEVSGVIAGRNNIQIRLGTAVVLEILDVVFEEGAVCSDPRVKGIDISELIGPQNVLVLGPDKLPLARAHCSVEGITGRVSSANTDAQGKATFALPVSGEWILTVTKNGMRPESVPFSQESTTEALLVQIKAGMQVRLICQQAPVLERGAQSVQLSLAKLDSKGEVIRNGPSVHLPKGLLTSQEGGVSFPEPGSYALMLSNTSQLSTDGTAMTSSATRCTFSDFVLKVRESDAGKTLDLVLPEDLFQKN